MDLLRTLPAYCPSCGEPIELVVDVSVPQQDYVEDCFVCCAPMRVLVDAGDPERPRIEVIGEQG